MTAATITSTAPISIAHEHIGAAAALDQRAEERRRGEAADAGADRVEDRDRDRAHLQREHFAHREVGGARRRGREEEDRGPRERLRVRIEEALHERQAGQRERDARQRIGRRDHAAPAHAVEEGAQQQRPEHVAHREGQDEEADLLGIDAVEARQHQRIGEEDRVVEKRLRDHQRQHDGAAFRVAPQQHMRHFRERRHGPAGEGHGVRCGLGGRCPDGLFDLRDDAFGFGGAAVREQPARAFGNIAAHEQDGQREHRAQHEPGAPALHGAEHPRVEQDQAQHRPESRAEPEAAVDREIHAAAHAGRDQLVDRRIDRRVLAADADARDEAAYRESGKARGERGGHRRTHVDGERQEEQALAPEPVGQAAEHERADDRAGDVQRAGPADLRRAEAERVGALEHAADGADDGHFEPVQHPGDAERQHDAPVPARPGQPVEPRGDVAMHHRAVL